MQNSQQSNSSAPNIANCEKQQQLRTTVLWVALLNLAYFFIEGGIALYIGSVSLFADSVDFFEDFAVNSLIAIALGFTQAHRSTVGRIMSGIIMLPAIAALAQAILKFSHPQAPNAYSLILTAGGAIIINGICVILLTRCRNDGGSLSIAAFLAARNDIAANAAIIIMGFITIATQSGWPDIIVGLFITALNFSAAKEVWEAANNESLAAQALTESE